MDCPECGESVALRKGVLRPDEDTVEKADGTECPECGEPLPHSEQTRLEKNL